MQVDALVVGGGISGIQAALDLATSGFKVFLVDEAPTIGGKIIPPAKRTDRIFNFRNSES